MNEIKLNETDILELNSILTELPYKYAVTLIAFLQKRLTKADSES